MPLFLALWLALLLAVPTASSSRAVGLVRGWASAGHGAGAGPGEARRRGVRGPAGRALPVPAPATAVVVARWGAPDAQGASPSLLAAASPPAAAAGFAPERRARTLDTSHAVAARGGLLPYFPTAPPLPG